MFDKKRKIAGGLLIFMFLSFLLGPIRSIGKEINLDKSDSIEKEVSDVEKETEEEKLEKFEKDVKLDGEEQESLNENIGFDEDDDGKVDKEHKVEEEADEKKNKIYVDSHLGETGNGSKEKPYKSLEDAIDETNKDLENKYTIYIAPGEYDLRHKYKIRSNISIKSLEKGKIILNIKNKNSGDRSYISVDGGNLDLKDLNLELVDDFIWKIENSGKLEINKSNLKIKEGIYIRSIGRGSILDIRESKIENLKNELSIGIDNGSQGFIGDDTKIESPKITTYIRRGSFMEIKDSEIKALGSEGIYHIEATENNELEESKIIIENSKVKSEGEIIFKADHSNVSIIDSIFDSEVEIYIWVRGYGKTEARLEEVILKGEEKNLTFREGKLVLDNLRFEDGKNKMVFSNMTKKDLELINMEKEKIEELIILESDIYLSNLNIGNLVVEESGVDSSNLNIGKLKVGRLKKNNGNMIEQFDGSFKLENSRIGNLDMEEEKQSLRSTPIEFVNYKDIVLDRVKIEDIYNLNESLMKVDRIDSFKMENTRIINNNNNLIDINASNYYLKNNTIIVDKNFKGKKDLEIFYGLKAEKGWISYSGKRKGKIDGLKVRVDNDEIGKNIIKLDLDKVDQDINRLDLNYTLKESPKIDIKLNRSEFLLTNSKIGDYDLGSNLQIKLIFANDIELLNNTIINQKLDKYEDKGKDEDKDKINIYKINNNILDISKSGDNDEGNRLDIQEIKEFNNNILLNLEEENLSSEDKENIFLDKYEEIKFKDKFNLELDKTSPAVDKGNNDYLAKEYDSDLANKPRISNKIVDIGAYEYQKIRDVEYIVRYVDENGQNLLNEIEKTGKENEKVVEKAKNINGYKLLGDKEKDLVLKYGEKNELVFKYKKIEKPEEPEKPEIPELNKKEHFAYILGYKDGSVGPENEMVREEVAAVFFRLLDPEYRESIRKNSHNFPDFPEDKWSAKHIGTLAKGGILEGNEDGDFLPDRPISRAEIAAIASRFDDGKGPRVFKSKFKDIEGHWAEEEIKRAEELGWVIGDENGNFNPDEKVSRGEFVTMVNRVLNRKVRKENILEGIRVFTDLEADKWYYEDMVEATNGHIYNEDRFEDGSEEWLELKDFNIEM